MSKHNIRVHFAVQQTFVITYKFDLSTVNKLRTHKRNWLIARKILIDISSVRRPECLCKLDPKFQFHCQDREEVGQDKSVSDGTQCAFSCEKLARNSHHWCTLVLFSLSSIGSYSLIRSNRVKLVVLGEDNGIRKETIDRTECCVESHDHGMNEWLIQCQCYGGFDVKDKGSYVCIWLLVTCYT